MSNCTTTWKSFLSDESEKRERERETVNTFAGTCSLLSQAIMALQQQKCPSAIQKVMEPLILYMSENSA